MTKNTAKHDALLDELLKDYTDPKDILGDHGLLRQLTQRLVERALETELTAHLGYAPHARNGSSPGNCRNGKGKKTVQTETAQFDIDVPRDRDGSFRASVDQKAPAAARRLR
jgi:putative transposase